jgi:hypothetical protein
MEKTSMPHNPSPSLSLEDIRLEAVRRRLEVRDAAAREATVFLEQTLQEIKRGGRDYE